MPSWASTRASVVFAPRTIPVSLVVATSSPLGPPVTSSGTNGSRRPFASYVVPSPCGTTGVDTRGAGDPGARALGLAAAGAAGAVAVAGTGVAAAAGAAEAGFGAAAAGGGGGEPPHALSVAQKPASPRRAPPRVTSDFLPSRGATLPAWAPPASPGGPEPAPGW